MRNNHFKSVLKDSKAIHQVAHFYGRKDNQVAYILQKLAWLPISIKARIFSMTVGNAPTRLDDREKDQLAIHDVATDYRLTDEQVIQIMSKFSCLSDKIQNQIYLMTI